MISDQELDDLFDQWLESPELTSWQSDLSGRERQDAQRLFRETVRRAIRRDNELAIDPSELLP